PPYLLHPPAPDGTTLRRAVATPDAVGLVRLDRPGEAFAGHRASGADRLGPGYGGEVRRLREEVDAGRVEAGGRLPPVIDVGIMGFGNHRNLSRRTLHNVWAAAHVPPLGLRIGRLTFRWRWSSRSPSTTSVPSPATP